MRKHARRMKDAYRVLRGEMKAVPVDANWWRGTAYFAQPYATTTATSFSYNVPAR
jgi:hypothetical protein